MNPSSKLETVKERKDNASTASVSYMSSSSAIALKEDIKPKAMELGLYAENEYEIIADIGLGICLPDDEKYTIKIKIGDFELNSSKPKEAKKGYNRWSERFNTTTFKTVY